MKIQGFLLIATLLLFTSFVQDKVEAFCGGCPPGRRQLSSKVSLLPMKLFLLKSFFPLF